jgi:hypothetical protein
MKKIAILLFLIALFAISFTSCKKDDEPILPKDLTSSLVGTYKGTLTFDGTNENDVFIILTKTSITQIFIKPVVSGQTSSFHANLSEASDGIAITVPEVVVTGGTIRGNTGLDPNHPSWHGGFVISTNEFFYWIKINISGVDHDELFIGYKQ